jgi:hypothetical protein
MEIQNKPHTTGFPVAQTISLTHLLLLYFTLGKNSILVLCKLYLLHITPKFYTTAIFFFFLFIYILLQTQCVGIFTIYLNTKFNISSSNGSSPITIRRQNFFNQWLCYFTVYNNNNITSQKVAMFADPLKYIISGS